ncbi:MAG: membrane anchor subunit of succinate dehydrogenase, Sdh4 [Trichoglossum hirsutum]|nr:MAG: membrane anchor subunit of succinate dehydrogenase, Sdh4 [Trichoglossum hirsutum]
MASLVRSAPLKQACTTAPASRIVFTKSWSRIPASKPSHILSAGQRPMQRAFQSALPVPVKAAAFHASRRRDILPPEPQHVEGTVNDAAPTPVSSPTHGSYHWTFERLVAVSLVPLTVAPFAAGSLNPATDAVLCAALLVHSHIGFDALIVDYLPPKRVPRTRKVFHWGLRAATLVVGVGLYEFETNDVGLTEAIKRVWTA